MKKILLLIIIFSIGKAFAEPAALVLVASNKVIAQQGSKERALSRGSQVFTGDTIVTGPGAQAQIKYTDGSLVSIQENTSYQIVSYSSKQNVEFKTKLDKGAIEYTSSKKKKGSIKTPVVALAILGTQLQAIATPSNTYLNVKQGLVQGGNQLVGPGQQFSSGSFNSSGNFTPGPIPWNYNDTTQSNTNSAGTTDSSSASVTEGNTQIASETITLTTSVVESTTINSTVNNIVVQSQPQVVETIALAEIIAICP
ncbi:FecR family protein [Legionella birminghamensis]|uniref:FecR family protein n=1 Tax=Legionella birminghamensis TaxID=28083 RepID=UPI00138F2B50|nr:FecR family protein [Legionella birminghamensis]